MYPDPEQILFAVAYLSTSTITRHRLYIIRYTTRTITSTTSTWVKLYMPVAVVMTSRYTTYMTDNIVPFDAELAADLPVESTMNKASSTTSDTVSDDVIKLRDVQQRFDALRTLIDSVNVMIQDWIDDNETYSADDVGVVSRMAQSMEQALHMTCDSEPE